MTKFDPGATLALRHDADGQTRMPRMQLRILAGPEAGQLLTTDRDGAVIGTSPGADIVLTDPTVSRFQCEIVVQAGRVIARDLGSRNGTFIDGVSVLQAHLRDGAVLTIGQTQVRFEIGDDSVTIPVSSSERFGTLLGQSVAMRRVFALLERAAASDATVLIQGETGTGKEEAAASIHENSPRAGGPFIVVDCGAIPPDLLESELFGHHKGAFTGAVASRVGAFQAAHGGTIFLDEMGELPLDLQPKLLRALESREIKPVGINRHVAVDVRVVAATNRDLKAAVNQRLFRSDLYYRLAVIQVELPPLRDRPDDIPALAAHFLGRMTDRAGVEAVRAADQFLADLTRHRWPGNVRELRNYLERCVALRSTEPPADRDAVPAAATPVGAPAAPAIDTKATYRKARDAWVDEFSRRYLTALLREHADDVGAAARAAGVDRTYLYRLMGRSGVR